MFEGEGIEKIVPYVASPPLQGPREQGSRESTPEGQFKKWVRYKSQTRQTQLYPARSLAPTGKVNGSSEISRDLSPDIRGSWQHSGDKQSAVQEINSRLGNISDMALVAASSGSKRVRFYMNENPPA